jgi:sugar lactone lactonase YvrE
MRSPCSFICSQPRFAVALSLLCAGLLLAQESPDDPAGRILWQYPLAADETAYSVALDASGHVYSTLSSQKLISLDASGRLRWEFPVASAFLNAPVIDNEGRIFASHHTPFTMLPAGVQAVNPDGSPAWFLEQISEFMPPVTSTGDILLVQYSRIRQWSVDGTEQWEAGSLYALGTASLRGDGALFVAPGLSLRPDGSTLWYHTDWAGRSTPAIGRDGTIYVGGESTPDVVPDEGAFRAFGTDGTIKWVYPSGSVASSPAILANDSVVFGTLSGKIVRVTGQGERVWEFDANAPVESSPAVSADGLIWCGASDGRFYALNTDGSVRWQWKLGSAVRSSPTIGPDGVVYITADGAGLFSIRGDAPLAETPWPMFRKDPAHRGRSNIQPQLPDTPTSLTAAETNERGAVTVGWASAPWAESYEIWRGDSADTNTMQLLATNITQQTSFSDRTAEFSRTYQYRVRARNDLGVSDFSSPVSGAQESRAWVFRLRWPVVGSPALGSDDFLRVATTRGGLLGVNTNGTIRWESDVGLILQPPVIAADGTAYVACVDGTVAAVDRDGKLRWRTVVSSDSRYPLARYGWPALTGDGGVLVCSQDGRVTALAPSGAQLWTVYAQCHETSAPVVAADGSIFISRTWGGVSLLKPDGAHQWTRTFPDRARAAIAPDGSFIAVGNGTLFSASPSGNTNWSVRFRMGGAPRTPIIGPDGSIYLTEPGSRFLALNPDASIRWALTNTLFSCPATVLEDGTVLVQRGAFLAAYDRNGAPQWQVHTYSNVAGTQDTLTPAPVIGEDGTIYAVGVTNLFAIRGRTGLAKGGWPAQRLDARQSASLAGPALALTGFWRTADSGWQLQWTAERGRLYFLEQSQDLREWTPAAELLCTNAISSTMLPTDPGRPHQYFRLRKKQ